MATSKRDQDSSSSDEEIQKVGGQHRIKNVVNSESDDNDSDIDVKPRQKKKLRKICESDSGTDKSASCSSSQSDSTSRAYAGKASNGKKSPTELSDSEQSEKCSICLCKFLGQQVACPETCDHKFCSECLLEWAKKMNTCPIDRLRFRYVLIQNHEAPEQYERISVEDRRRGFCDTNALFQTVCELCGDGENLLVCARCLLGYHSVCLRLPSQPEQNDLWHCPYCAYLVLHDGRVPENIYIGDSFYTLLRVSLRRDFLEGQRNAWLSHFYRMVGLTPPSSTNRLGSPSRIYFNENSSSDSSDESTEELSSSNDRRRQLCKAIRNRRNKRTSERLRARVLNTLNSSSTNGPSSSTSSRPHPIFTISDSSDDSDYGFQDHGDVLSRFPRRTSVRSKGMMPRLLNLPSLIRPLIPPSLDPDILEDIRVIQANCPNTSSNDDAPLSGNQNDIGRQHPINPAQNSSSGSSRSTFPSSSSSSATSGSSLYDLYNMPGCSMLASSTAAEGYDTDACSMVTHRSYCNTSQQEDSKRDLQESVHMKDIRKSQSDDEVDIYSDIEYANDDTSLDTDVLQIQSSFKPDESHAAPSGDGTDSSDNDLVIDEDVAGEEDASKTCIDKETLNVPTHQISAAESENSCSNIMEDGEPTSESNVLENIQSPDQLDDANQDGDWQANNESEESSEPVSCNMSSDFKMKTYIDVDLDSQDDNDDVHNDDHSQNSFDLKSENLGPKSPLDENSFSPRTDEIIAEDDSSTDNVIEQTSLSVKKKHDCLAETVIGNDTEAKETGELTKETNSFIKYDNTEDEDCNNKTEDEDCNKTEDEDCNKTEDEDCNKTEDEDCNNKTEDEDCNNKTEDEDYNNKAEDEEYNKTEDEECNKTEDEECNKTDEDCDNKTEDEDCNYKTEDEDCNNKIEDDCNDKIEDDDFNNKAEDDEKDCESDENNECVDNNSIVNHSPANSIPPECQIEGTSNNLSSTKTFAHSTTPFFTENPTTGLKEFPTKASLKECLPIKGEFETKEREKNSYQNIDLGIEDISDAASDDLNQLGNDTPEPMECEDVQDATLHDVEKNVAKLFGPEDMESSPVKYNRKHRKDDFCEGTSNDSKRYSRQALIDDQEEGEIIEDIPYQRKSSHRRGHFIHEDDEYMDSAPRINISDLPRIPKIKRESKSDIPEEPPLEIKRTSVLGRVDLGSGDIGWKRLSKHTRERSYRDGRPKDENLLFRERELKSKDRNRKHASNEQKNEQKTVEPERRRDDKKQDGERSKERNHSHDRRSEKSKSDYEKSSKSDWNYSDKKDKEKHSKHKDRHDRDKTKKERHESKKDRHEKSKEKSRREDSKHDREKLRAEDKYAREVERFHQKEETYERIFEKPREKEHKHKHKDSKSDSGKKCKDEKHKRTHSREYFSEKREREVRKVDDKLKIVVEHKESRSKDRSDKLTDKRDLKHEKKHREIGHHYERKKKELSPVSYTELTPIESKEIFAKGDSIIINVNFNRASPREVVSSATEEFNREKKLGDLVKADNDTHGCKLTHSSLDPDKKSDMKRPTTPLGRNSQLLSSDEYYWQGGDEINAKSPIEEKGASEKIFTANEESSNSPVNDFGADDNVTDSEDEENLPETHPVANLPKEEPDIISSEKGLEGVFGESEEKEFGSRRRSPLHPPSPPSPPDNDSYDPCEPTKSPSPPPLPNPPSPPLPSTGGTLDRPKPPPSPELPPLPPEPEPTDILFQEDGKSSAQCPSMDSANVVISSPAVSQQTEHNLSTTESAVSTAGVLLPPPRFMGHQNVTTMQSQLTPSKTTTWQATNPPPSTVIFQSNHMQPVIPANFLPTHIPTVGFAPPHVSATVLPPNSSIPLTSQVRHLQLGPHSVVPTNTLLSSVPINHLTLPQVQISHPPLPNPSVSAAMHQHHPVIAMQAHSGNLPNSMASHCAGINLISVQNQLSNVASSLQSQHGNLVSAHHPQNVTQLFPSQNQTTHLVTVTSQKSEKPLKSSPAKDRSEVIDMDVDSPYSPGDSPSMDSAYDYSPPSSPAYQDNAPVTAVKDAFDSLFGAEQAGCSQTDKTSGKSHSHSNCGERERKKQKLESKSEAAKNRHHSVRLQVDKVKSRKEQKLSERKDILTKLDDSQLTILDELPSSAVEMQVKEKFLKKLNRQERVVEEVKLALKPYYKTREVSKEEYKDILRKSVPKICHNKSGEINPQKVKYFIDCYVKKMKHHRKKSSKKRKSSKYS